MHEYKEKNIESNKGHNTRVSPEERLKKEMEEAGPGKCSNCIEVYEGIKLDKYLKKIRRKSIEYVLLIAIKKNQIVDYKIFAGNKNSINVEDYFKSGAVGLINAWIKKDAVICNYHNHPKKIAARPSKKDYKIDNRNDIWKAYEKHYKIELPDDFKYDEWGVVTEVDFFSSYQKKDVLDQLYSREINWEEKHKYDSLGNAMRYLNDNFDD